MGTKGQAAIDIIVKDDGSFEVRFDCSKVVGSEREIKELLEKARAEFGGSLVIEKHVHKHTHDGHEDNRHRH